MKKIYLKFLSLYIISICLSQSANTQAFKLVKDINQQQDANPANSQLHAASYAVANGKAYFAADDGIHGSELWRTDGTAAGTALVKDIVPGSTGSAVNYIYAYNNKVYFFASANNGATYQFWQSDGTEAGTGILKDSILVLLNVAYTVFNNELYFTCSNILSGGSIRNELWKTDGTKQATKKVLAITDGQNGWTNIDDFITFNNRLYFTTSSGQQLWSTSGNTGNAVKFNFSAFSNNGNQAFSQIRIRDGKLFFNYNAKYYASNGDSASTVVFNNSGSSTSAMLKDEVFDIFFDNGIWLAKVDTITPGKKIELKKITPYSSLQNGVFLQYYSDSLLYFSFIDEAYTQHLWVTDGTVNGTVELATGDIDASSFFIHGKELYFSYAANNSGYEPWHTDGTPNGTTIIKDVNPGIYSSNPSCFTSFNSSTFFSAKDNLTGIELWRTDGTNAGTYMVKNINTSNTASANPLLNNNFEVDTINNKLLFTVNDGTHGYELWSTDGSTGGTNMLADAFPGSAPFGWNEFYNRSFTRFNGSDYYFTATKTNSCGLYKTSGTSSSTGFVSNIYNWSSGTIPLGMGATRKYIFGIIGQSNVISYSPSIIDTMGSKLFVYDGSGAPVIIKHGFFTPGAPIYNQYGTNLVLPALGDNICFFTSSPFYNNNGIALWKSDGTEEGTQMVTKIYADRRFDFNTALGYTKIYKDDIYFVMNSGSGTGTTYLQNYNYLWKTDLTADGTKLVLSLPLSYEAMQLVNEKLYFVAFNNNSEELWVTDNTEAGTHIVKSTADIGSYLRIRNLTELNNALYFLITNNGQPSLWKTDGTGAGAVKLKDNVSWITGGNGVLYYAVDNTIWQYDGKTGNTKQLDMTGLEGVSLSYPMAYAGGKLYVSGYTYQYGNELYVSNATVLPVTMLSFTGQLQGNNSLLQWATVNEQQNSHFNVQRSLHGNDFVSIGKVGAANGSKQNDYSYIDAGITSLGVEKVYYRLQQVDLDGKSTYSKTILVDIPVKSLYIAPNPATSFTAVYSQVNIPGAVIKLADINGKVLYSNKTNLVAGGKTIIPLTGYAKGVYTVIIQSAGTKQEEFKIVIE